MELVLVDTDVVSFSVKGDSRAALYEPEFRGKRLCVAMMTVAELRRWPLESGWGRNRIAELDRVIGRHIVVPPDMETAEAWAQVFVARKKAGRPILHGDCWIAATAIRRRVPLITHNAADYRGVPGLTLITHSPE